MEISSEKLTCKYGYVRPHPESCKVTPEETGGVYKFDKIVLAIFQNPNDQKNPALPPVLRYENLSKLLKQAVEKNFANILNGNDGKKPILLLSSAKRGEGWEDVHDPHSLSILVHVYYAPRSVSTSGVEEYGR